MISTEQTRDVATQLQKIYSRAEVEMLKKLQKRIDKGITQVGWTEKKSSEIMGLRKELDKLAGQIAGTTKEEMEKSLKDAYKKGQKSANADFGLPPVVASGVVPARLMALILESNGITQNVSETVLRKTLDAYREIQAEVSAGVLTGVDTRKQAAQRMLNLLADKGITGFVDKLGRNWEMAAYTEMATRTVVAQAAIAGHIDRQVQAGRDLVLISDHAGECPLCRPWEGKVLSISGTSMEYPPLSTAKSKGLFHPNCRHTLTGYIPGLSKIGPRPNGGTPEQYEYTQKQRYNERQIRRWKRREAVAMSPQEANKSKTHIRAYQLKQRELLKEYEAKFGMTLNRRGRSEGLLTGKTGLEGEGWTGVKGPDVPITPVKVPKDKKPPEPKPVDKPQAPRRALPPMKTRVNLNGVHAKARPALESRIKELYAQYPEVFNNSIETIGLSKLDYNTSAEYRLVLKSGNPFLEDTQDNFKRGEIHLNKDNYAFPSIIKKRGTSVKRGFHPEGTENFTGTMVHEVGHAVDFNLRRELHTLSPKEVGAYKMELKAILNNLKPGELSKYATSSMNEMVGEAFCELHLSSTPRPKALEIKAVMDKYLKKIGRGGINEPR